MSINYYFEGYWKRWLLIIFVVIGSFNTALYPQGNRSLGLGKIFQDHMVLQRNKPIQIWGHARKGEQIQVKIGENTSTAITGSDGKWRVELPPLTSPGPYVLLVKSEAQQVELNDVLIGDVWIASGQSNMEWPISGTNFEEKDSFWIDEADIRLLKVHPTMDYQPQTESPNNGWMKLTNDNVRSFSAVGYHFAKQVHRATGIPIGIISANLGATAVETWMSNQALANFPQFPSIPQKSFKVLQYAFDSGKAVWSEDVYYSGKGMTNKWYEASDDQEGDWKNIQAAGNTWEAVSELQDFDGPVWFRKKFDLPSDFKGDSLDLNLLQIDDHDITWVNGQKIGETFGRHNHRNYKIAATTLKPRNNLLVVRIFDSGGIGGFTTNAFWGNELLWGDWEYRKGVPIDPNKFKDPKLPDASPFSTPGVLYNGTIAPLTSMGITGVIWYQGESNEQRAFEYRKLFPALIRDWRQQFNQGAFPFLFVQLANYRQEVELPQESLWAELRESQSQALELPNVGMVVAIDLGEAGDIHPENKEDVGKRLGQLALKMVYHKNIVAESPRFEELEVQEDKAILKFKNTGTGLENINKFGCIRGFQVAGEDKKFFWAQAILKGEKVYVWSNKVKTPVAVRYGWSDNPGPLDLYNSGGLPLEPFRTDNWRLSTEGKEFEDGPRF